MRTSATCKLPACVRALGALCLGVVVAFVTIGMLADNETSARESMMSTIGAALQSANPAGLAEIVAPDTYESDRKSSPTNARTAGRNGNLGAAASKAPSTARVDLRCWQDGVLIVHESRVTPAVEPFSYALKFPARDAGGLPMYLATW